MFILTIRGFFIVLMTEHGDEKAEKLAQSQETSEGLSQVDLIQGLSLPYWKSLYLQVIDAGEAPLKSNLLLHVKKRFKGYLNSL